MRYVKKIFDIVDSGEFVGSNKSHGRVTIQPSWHLQKTNPAYGSSVRGPYRWFHQSFIGEGEYEVPNIKSISIDRSKSQDIATCNITMYNQYHDLNVWQSENDNQLGRPGYFWYDRGNSASNSRWKHQEAFGAYNYFGTWDNNFSWKNVIVPHAMIRTYQGYGGYDEYGVPLPISDVVYDESENTDGSLVITGTWLIDTISAGNDGMINISCRDVGRLLLDQFCFPPIVPDGLYPVQYYPPGKSAFDSPWGPKAKIGEIASRGEVRLTYSTSSVDAVKNSYNYNYNVTERYGKDEIISTGKASHSVDGNWKTYSLSEGYQNFDDPDALTWFEFNVNQKLDSIGLKCWAGGYECYISIKVNNQWVGAVLQNGKWVAGSNAIPYGGNLSNTSIPYIKKINIPAAIPDNMEPEIVIDFPSIWTNPEDQLRKTNQVTVQKLRVSFKKLYYSSVTDSGNKHYRAGIRNLVGYRVGDPTSQYTGNFSDVKWTFSMTSHPTRGYWIVDADGRVSGFGDAADYDSSAFGDIVIRSISVDNYPTAITANPDGKGYWVLDREGHVYAQGSAVWHGEVSVPPPPPSPYLSPEGKRLVGTVLGFNKVAMDIAATHTGNGYWVVYSDGTLRGFGDASPSFAIIPNTAVGNAMYSKFINDGDQHPGNFFFKNGGGWDQKRATAITAHPSKMGCWVANGHGEVFAFGDANPRLGQLNNRIYADGTVHEFALGDREWGKNIESTASGEGYWMAFGGGRIAAFGDAIESGGTQDIWLEYRKNVRLGVDISEQDILRMEDFSFFRALLWDVARDPDGGKNSKGFWALLADGSVGSYDAEAWGRPGYFGLSGYRWHDGNYEDYADIVKEFLMWAGFLYNDPAINSNLKPYVYGNVESTGIKTDTVLPTSMFDKKTIIDIIKQMAEVTAYVFYIQEDGSVRFESPNWWSPGNYNNYGEKIYVDTDGNQVQPDADIFNPNLPAPYTSNAVWTLRSGQSVTCNGATLKMQGDGNLVLTALKPIVGPGSSRGVVWESGTDGYPGAIASVKKDGGFFIYSSDGVSEIWSANSGSGDFSNAYVTLDPTQEFSIHARSTQGVGEADVMIWSTGTALDMVVEAPSFVPIVDEEIDMINYNVTLNWDSMRSELIVGAEGPDPSNPSATNFTRFKPPISYMEVADNVPALRGIERPGMWVNTNFTNKEETRLMLELMSLHSFFAQRTGSINCAANPCITLNDQIRIFERTTSETYIHYVTGINTTMDLDTGSYTANINTHWLGDESDWVIKTAAETGAYIDRFRITDRVDRWQRETNRNLVNSTNDAIVSYVNKISGGFASKSIKGS